MRKNNTIAHREEFRGAQRQIAELEEILAEMRQEETPESYKILCKNYVRRIRQIQSKIDEYLGITPMTVAWSFNGNRS